MSRYLEAIFKKQTAELPSGYVYEADAESGLAFFKHERLGIRLAERPVIIPSGVPLETSYMMVYAFTTQEGVQSLLCLGQMPPMLPTTMQEPAEFASLGAIADTFGTRELWGDYCIAFRVPAPLVTQVQAPGRDLWMVRFDQDIVSQIFQAARAGQGVRVAKLCDAGCPGNVVDEDCISVLMMASAGGSARAIQALMQNGADSNYAEPNNQRTALMFAAQYGQVDAAGALIQANADPAQVDDAGNTPLMWAAIGNQAEAAGFLAIKSEKTAVNREGLSAIEVARQMGHEEVVAALT